MDIERELSDPERMAERVDFHARVIDEEKAAEELCDRLLKGPSKWWGTAVANVRGSYTAGMVAVLISRSRSAWTRSPAEALDLVEIALGVAKALGADDYPYDHVVKLRGQALLEKAFFLSFVGRYREADATANLSELLLKQAPLPFLDLARLDLVRSNIARNTEKYDEAIAFARRAGETYLQFGSRAGWLKARTYEGAALFSRCDYAGAASVWRSMEAYAALLTPEERAMLLHNIGLCACETGDLEEAARSFSRAATEFDRLGFTVNRAKCRYAVGKVLFNSGKAAESIGVLRQSWDELEELGIANDAALAALQLAEALLVVGRVDEVPEICRMLIDRYARDGMHGGAMTALAFLREAIAMGSSSPSLVHHVYLYIRDSTGNESRPFEPPERATP
jgi:tetratricopeptide (TPR) repeat protein